MVVALLLGLLKTGRLHMQAHACTYTLQQFPTPFNFFVSLLTISDKKLAS